MIYFDSAATSFQKPSSVSNAMIKALKTMSSPGRGTYSSAMHAAEMLYRCREAIADMFRVPSVEQVIFCSNATHAINIAVRSLIAPGDRVVVSGYEHNSVIRPLAAAGAVIDVAAAPLFDNDLFLKTLSEKIPGARAVFCTHVSNVFGYVLPIEFVAAQCRERGIPLIVDASQSAGILDLDFSALGAAFVAMPGHKSLLGPQGSGILIANTATKPLIYGGTGSASESISMPDFLPDRLEAGTHNIPAVAGLYAGIKWLKEHGLPNIQRHEQNLLRHFAESMAENRHFRLFLSPYPERQSSVLSFTSHKMDVDTISEKLAEHDICVRSGLHCAPLAHRTTGTLATGTVRVSFSPFNTLSEVRQLSRILWEITG